jgi:transcriptional regulator with XRE-family HTH domain
MSYLVGAFAFLIPARAADLLVEVGVNGTPQYIRITYERTRRRWSQTQVGQLIKSIGGYRRALTQNEVSLIERGRLLPDDDQLDALGRVFNISPAHVLMKPCSIVDPEEQDHEANNQMKFVVTEQEVVP